MLLFKRFTATFLLFLTGAFAPLAEAAGTARAEELFSIGPLPITNSMVTSWVVSLFIILAVRWMVGKPKLVPGRGQAVIENMLVGLREMVEPIIGKKALRASLPLVLGFFVYIVIQNWSGLIPGVGSIGWGYTDEEGTFRVAHSLIRPGNADWNGTIALATIAMAAWLFIVLKYAGIKVLILDLFGNKADKKEVGSILWLMLIPMFLLIGVIEVVSILIRPLTLSIRLFGNVYGGESLMHAMHYFPAFYFLELLVGLVQAFVFILLFSVYIGLICNHGDEHEEGSHH